MSSRDYYRNLSFRLSRVMDDIGVNEEAVMSRRRAYLIKENLFTLSDRLLQKNNQSLFVFGSQTEGTTTGGLKSDTDLLIVLEDFNLIQDLKDWVPRTANLLMIQDDRFPGQCKLQLFKPDGPYPADMLPSDYHTFDEAGRVLLNNFQAYGVELHGPAELVDIGVDFHPIDVVSAIRCKTWPNGYKMWSRHPRQGNWPTSEMISYMEHSGCFVVGVAHRLDEKKSESWRISTSLAERRLMFSLNITQIRCYTLIKMIVKTFIDPLIPDVISSYICKNLLFHCVEKTRPDFWEESNLLRCVNQILLIMLEVIRCMNCPSYFNESINILLGRVNKDNQVVLMGQIWNVLVSEGDFIWKIRFDNIYQLIDNDDKTIYEGNDCSFVGKRKNNHTPMVEEEVIAELAYHIQNLMLDGRSNQRDHQNTMFLFALQGPLQYIAAILLFPFLCSHLATLKANVHILHGEMLLSRTPLLYKRSLGSDLTSSRLKFASYLFCTGQFERVRSFLLEIDGFLAAGFFAVCGCDALKGPDSTPINMDPSLSILSLFPSHVSLCVLFSQAERRCFPRELQYEMYRSTEQEKLQRNKDGRDRWMDLACIDSITYLHFLSYMTSRHLGLHELSLQTLERIKERTCLGGRHRDTVYNLLGQCYEYENRFEEALACYCQSLRVKPTNNAARWHIVLLLYTINQKEEFIMRKLKRASFAIKVVAGLVLTLFLTVYPLTYEGNQRTYP